MKSMHSLFLKRTVGYDLFLSSHIFLLLFFSLACLSLLEMVTSTLSQMLTKTLNIWLHFSCVSSNGFSLSSLLILAKQQN